MDWREDFDDSLLDNEALQFVIGHLRENDGYCGRCAERMEKDRQRET